MARILSNRVFSILIAIRRKVISKNIILYRTYYINFLSNYIRI